MNTKQKLTAIAYFGGIQGLGLATAAYVLGADTLTVAVCFAAGALFLGAVTTAVLELVLRCK